MANRRLAATATGCGRANAIRHSQHVVSLLSLRDDLMTDIDQRLRAKTTSPLVKKATALLTRFWARANWQGREEIIRTAKWLLNVAREHPATASPKVGMKRTDKRGVGVRRQRSKLVAQPRGNAP